MPEVVSIVIVIIPPIDRGSVVLYIGSGIIMAITLPKHWNAAQL